MKRTILFLLFTLIGLAGFAQPTDLFFSEYVEGSNNNKALEIYNGTGTAIDLSGYTIYKYTNGGTSPSPSGGYTFPANTILQNDDVFVIANSAAGATLLLKADIATNNATFTFNGNDAIELRKNNGTTLDVIGQIGTDPGSQWGSGNTTTKDHTLSRKEGTTSGDANGNNAFDPSIEWDGHPKDYFVGLGVVAPLPIVLSRFNAMKFGNSALLSWTTATETNNDYFTIERSVDGRYFEAIGQVQGAGNSTTERSYEFTDRNPVKGVNYYRLTQTDFDGRSETFNVVSVDFGSHTPVSITPTPVKDVMVLNFEPMEQGGQVSVYDLSGRRFFDARIEAGAGQAELNLSALPAGQYIARITGNAGSETIRFVKM